MEKWLQVIETSIFARSSTNFAPKRNRIQSIDLVAVREKRYRLFYQTYWDVVAVRSVPISPVRLVGMEHDLVLWICFVISGVTHGPSPMKCLHLTICQERMRIGGIRAQPVHTA